MVRRRAAPACACALLLAWLMTPQGCVSLVRAQSGPVAEESDEPPEYRATVVRALAEFDAQRYSQARDLFQKAHRIYPSARSLRALGTVEFELGNYVECSDLLEQALQSDVRALDAAARRKTQDLLQRAQQFVGKVALELLPKSVAGVMLQIDGVSTSPSVDRTLALSVGQHQLSVSAPGYEQLERALAVRGGTVQQLTLTLKPSPQPSTPSTPPSPPLKETVPDAPSVFPPQADVRQERPLYKNPWLWTGVGALVVGGVLTGVLLALRDDPEPAEPIPGDIGGVVHVLRLRP